LSSPVTAKRAAAQRMNVFRRRFIQRYDAPATGANLRSAARRSAFAKKESMDKPGLVVLLTHLMLERRTR
jgi:hypothetical protein